ncbi:MAG: PHB depolymerase family esterase [Acidimicrobiales bacterium]
MSVPSSRSARRAVAALGLAAAALVAAACSGSSSSSNTASGAPATTAAGGAAAGAGSSGTAGTASPTGTQAAPVPSKGCGTSTATAMDKQRQEVAAGGDDRWFLLTVPAAHDGKTPLPLVLDFHGLMEGAQIHSTMTKFSDLAQQEGFVVAFPHGTGNPVHWNANLEGPNPDLEYFDAMLDQIGSQLCIDTSRVYSTGLSYGAIMTSMLACTRADKLAAIAPVDGVQLPDGCSPSKTLPVLAMHGTADPILRFNGGVGSMVNSLLAGQLAENTETTQPPYDLNGEGYPKTVAGWAAKNGCDPTPKDTKVSDTVIRRVYSCPQGHDVEFVIVVGGGHSWPGSEFSRSIEKVVGPTTFDIDATKAIWEFFQRYPAS